MARAAEWVAAVRAAAVWCPMVGGGARPVAARAAVERAGAWAVGWAVGEGAARAVAVVEKAVEAREGASAVAATAVCEDEVEASAVEVREALAGRAGDWGAGTEAAAMAADSEVETEAARAVEGTGVGGNGVVARAVAARVAVAWVVDRAAGMVALLLHSAE